MNGRHQRKKKNFFIQKNFQGKFILGLFLAVVVGGFFFAVLLGLFSADTMTISYNNSDVQVGATPFMLLKRALFANWIFIVLAGIVLVLIGIYFTHRVAGPLYRFQKVLTEMNAGNLANPICLREKDEGKQLAKMFNEFNQTLSANLWAVKEESTEIHKILEQINSDEEHSREDLIELGRKAKERSDELQKRLSFFTLIDEAKKNG